MRVLKINIIADCIIRTAKTMFESAAKLAHPRIRDIAPHHTRPPEGRSKLLRKYLSVRHYAVPFQCQVHWTHALVVAPERSMFDMTERVRFVPRDLSKAGRER
ncbi:hypothetical protein ACJJTC_006475 [Scirpophaga incertulas]